MWAYLFACNSFVDHVELV